MRRRVAVGVAGIGVAFAVPATAWASEATLRTDKHVIRQGVVVRFTGKLDPAAPGQTVTLYRVAGSSATPVGDPVATKADGTFVKSVSLGRPGQFFVRVSVEGSPDEIVPSNRVTVRMRPSLTARFAGQAEIGGRLFLVGRLTPRASGVLLRTLRGRTHRVSLTSAGRFRIRLPTDSAKPLRIRLRVAPSPYYVAVTRVRERSLTLPSLSMGSRGPAVRVLERTLRAQHYALPAVNASYTLTTAEAVYAFQKVHGLSRTGRVGARFWRLLSRSHVPRARVARGTHIEISKTKQVLFEVRKGRVVNVLHTSTGATGNTPVGTFHVYGKVPGYNAKQMYYSLFFKGGFAIHGYHSVPPYPASHGCARIPIWAARGLYNRWGVGSTVMVFG